MSQWNYFVTAQKPTAVTHALGPLRFTSPKPADLAVARAGRLEIFRLTSQGSTGGSLEAVCDLPINCRVAVLQAVRPVGGQPRDVILLGTEKRQFVVLRYDMEAQCIITAAIGNLHDATARPVDHAPLCTCDPGGRAATVYLYEGLLKVIALSSLASSEARNAASAAPVKALDLCAASLIFSTRVAEPRVLDIAFLHTALGEERPILAVLHADGQGSRFLSSWAIDLQVCDLCPGRLDRAPMQAGSAKLAPMPLPLGGTLVLGGSMVTYHDDSGRRMAGACGGPREVAVVALMEEDGSRWLLGGIDGSIWLLRVQASAAMSAAAAGSSAAQQAKVTTLTVEHLGLASPPRALVYLGEGRAFVGSAVGDSQLLRLSAVRNSEGMHFAVEDHWTNLGPILDFCVADIDEQGQNQVVTCSGCGRTGALRFVRIGIGVNEVGSLAGFDGVLGMWSIGGVAGVPADGNCLLAALVLSFVGSTRVLALTGDALSNEGAELAERAAPGFVCDEQTLFCCEARGVVLQVTRGGVRAASLEALAPLAWWAPPSNGVRALAATAAPGGLIVSLSSGELVLLQVQPAAVVGGVPGLTSVSSTHLAGEVACMHVKETFFAAGLWTRQLQLIRLQGRFEPVHTEVLPSKTIPRSVCFARLAGELYLLLGLGDGRLLSFCVNEATGALSQRKAVSLGTQPIHLLPFRSQQEGDEHIFATGDRPMIVHAHAPAPGQLVYAAVNLRQVSHVAPFDVAPFADCFAFVSERRLMIGAFDQIQRMHVRTVPLGESPHRIAYLRQSSVFAVGCQPELSDDVATSGGSATGLASASGMSGSSSSSSCPPPPDVHMDRGFTCASLRFVHGRTLEIVQTFRLEQNEHVSALAAVVFEGDSCEYLVVGTAFVSPEEPEPLHGRILIYGKRTGGGMAKSASFSQTSCLEVAGAVYSLLPFRGMLLGSVNNRVCLWRRNDGQLECVCSNSANIMALYMQAMGDHVLVGDLMRSASLLLYKSEEQNLVEAARDTSSVWLTAVGMLTQDVFLCTDDAHNVFTLVRGSAATPGAPDAATTSLGTAGPLASPGVALASPGTAAGTGSVQPTSGGYPVGPAAAGGPSGGPPVASAAAAAAEDAQARLERVGQMHIGEFVNRMPRAALVEHPAVMDGSSEVSCAGTAGENLSYVPVEQVVWASVDGAIGLIASLRGEREFARLSLIQDVVSQVVSTVEGLPHNEWRDFWAEPHGPLPHKGFIDGNLMLSVLELSRPNQQAIADKLKGHGVLFDGGGVVGLLREIEELARLH